MSDTEMAEDANNQGETSHDESGSLMIQSWTPSLRVGSNN